MDGAQPALIWSLAAAGGYLLGSVPWGMVLVRMAGLGDIRDIGSGNIGATNVLRTGNKLLAFLTVVLDSGKGGAAVWAATEVWGVEAGLIAGFTAVLGHNYPVWLKFKGGKGVATAIGVLLVAAFPVGVLACATWLLVAGTLRMSSLAGLVALAASPAYAMWLFDERYALMAGGIAVLSIIRHKENIKRLLAGTEPRIGKSKEEPGETGNSDTPPH